MWNEWLRQIFLVSEEQMTKNERYYQCHFNSRLPLPTATLRKGYLVFVHPDGHRKDEPRLKLAGLANGPYTVVFLNDDLVFLWIQQVLEPVSRDRIVTLPRPELM